MDWKAAQRQERAALLRIVALLFALADLADLSAGRALPVRAFVLWLLRRAEGAACAFVLGAAEPVFSGPARSTPEDAARLAHSLRALACELERQARSEWCARKTAAVSAGTVLACALGSIRPAWTVFASPGQPSVAVPYDTS